MENKKIQKISLNEDSDPAEDKKKEKKLRALPICGLVTVCAAGWVTREDSVPVEDGDKVMPEG
jgi:hypothetical protein